MMKSLGFNSKVIVFVLMVIFLSGYTWIQRLATYHSEFSDILYYGVRDEKGPMGSDLDNQQLTSSIDKLVQTVMTTSLVKIPQLKSSSSSYHHNNSDHNLTVIVHTSLSHFERRQIIRDTWGGWLRDNGQQVFFIIGSSNQSTILHEVRQKLRKEHQLYGDIIEYDFIDSYRNLTLKTLLTLRFFNEKILKLRTKGKQVRWSLNCTNPAAIVEPMLRRTQYLLKTDDDVVYHPGHLLRWRDYVPEKIMGTPNDTKYYRGIIVGNVIPHIAPNRNKASKYVMSEEMYPGKKYPNFVSGTGYLMSEDVVRSLFITAVLTKRCKFLPLEDVFLGLCATKSVKMIDPYTYSKDDYLVARMINHDGFIVYDLHSSFNFCRTYTPYLIKISHDMKPSLMKSVWKKLNTSEDEIERECGQKKISTDHFRAYPLENSFVP
ncbi:beta-1,3-galactosyltransferase 5-like [Brevipalpus obovatus]|uniref:beta-1,3-galactosyltransferase 5-like n=1 Tax=Brevipalpus obovatus TaxID=246614 RepID=UPI003D9F9EB0